MTCSGQSAGLAIHTSRVQVLLPATIAEMDLYSVVPNSTPPWFVNSQLVSTPASWDF